MSTIFKNSNRFRQEKMLTLFDDSVKTWILTCVCAPQCIRNPYVTAKLVEALFVISPSVQPNSGLQFSVREIFISIVFGMINPIAGIS